MVKIAVLLICVCGIAWHPVHVSVTNITKKSDSLYIQIQTFADDWELAYFHYTGERALFADMNEDLRDWFELYLSSSFSIEINPFLAISNIATNEC